MTKTRGRRRWLRAAGWAAAAVLVAAAGFWLAGRMRPTRPEIGRPPAAVPRAEVPEAKPKSPPPVPEPPAPTAPVSPPPVARVALVVDDLGRSLADLDRLAALGIPISYAVLPYEPRTAEIVARLRERGAEILCHLPMEARDGENPGPGALLDGLSARRLRRLARAALDAVPGAAGVNNHMGSRLTADADAMTVVLDEVAARRQFFLDSRTTADSRAFEVARRRGVAAASRDVFIDADPGPDAARAAFAALLEMARANGAAIGIAHPRAATFEVLASEVPRAIEAGFEFVPVSFLLERDEGLAE
jgi:polysaccharide deacetylase 2 family uncharacterized protein YibQ